MITIQLMSGEIHTISGGIYNNILRNIGSIIGQDYRLITLHIKNENGEFSKVEPYNIISGRL